MWLRRWGVTLLVLCGMMLAAGCAPRKPPTAHELNARLGRGVNLGNALEAPREGEWGMVLQADYFRLIREVGFEHVRVPIRWSAHAETAPPYTVDPAFFERVDWVIEQARKHELLVVLNMHHYDEIFADPQGHAERFKAIWQQIAERYKDQPPEVMFELLNEPHDALTPARWNALAAETLAVARESNPNRVVVIGPGDWNSHTALNRLSLPEDDAQIIVTFHYYLPFQFTHQGAEWVSGADAWLGTTWEPTALERTMLQVDMQQVGRWAEAQGRPLYLGEFGAYSKAPQDSRVRWTEAVARAAEAEGFSWAYWEFGAGFGVYDRQRQAWNTDILEALIPPE